MKSAESRHLVIRQKLWGQKKVKFAKFNDAKMKERSTLLCWANRIILNHRCISIGNEDKW